MAEYDVNASENALGDSEGGPDTLTVPGFWNKSLSDMFPRSPGRVRYTSDRLEQPHRWTGCANRVSRLAWFFCQPSPVETHPGTILLNDAEWLGFQ